MSTETKFAVTAGARHTVAAAPSNAGSAVYGAEPVTIDVRDYAEVKVPSAISRRTDSFMRAALGPLVVFAAAAVIAVTIFMLLPVLQRSSGARDELR